MHAYPHYPERKTISLDGIWDFTFLNTSEPLAALQISPSARPFLCSSLKQRNHPKK